MKSWILRLLVCGLFPAVVLSASALTVVSETTGVQESRYSTQITRDTWTPDLYFSAKPPEAFADVDLDRPSPKGTSVAVPEAVFAGTASRGTGRLSSATRLFPEAWLLDRTAMASVTRPKDQGAAKLPYTSSRLTPLASDREYPFRAIGKLFFLTPQGPGFCSAAVISYRIILTAGHCVHSGTGGVDGFYSDFVFVPAYREGSSPFGAWGATAWTTTTVWATSRGRLPNAADYALLELEDEQGHRIGDVVGGFAVVLKKTAPNHVHIIGYPAALDGGEIVHVVASSSSKKAPANTWVYGSDMAQGSSGGPWVMNIGDASDGQPTGSRNVIVGVTSYVAAGANRIEGSSTLDAPLLQLFNLICGHQAGNCS